MILQPPWRKPQHPRCGFYINKLPPIDYDWYADYIAAHNIKDKINGVTIAISRGKSCDTYTKLKATFRADFVLFFFVYGGKKHPIVLLGKNNHGVILIDTHLNKDKHILIYKLLSIKILKKLHTKGHNFYRLVDTNTNKSLGPYCPNVNIINFNDRSIVKKANNKQALNYYIKVQDRVANHE